MQAEPLDFVPTSAAHGAFNIGATGINNCFRSDMFPILPSSSCVSGDRDGNWDFFHAPIRLCVRGCMGCVGGFGLFFFSFLALEGVERLGTW